MLFFFYGTLLDRRVRRAVIGPVAERLEARPATLRGWRRVRLEGRGYPVIVPDRAGSVEGCVFGPLTASATARLTRFEGPEYRMAQLEVATADGQTVSAFGFVGSERTRATSAEWRFDEWERTERTAFLRRLKGNGGRAGGG